MAVAQELKLEKTTDISYTEYVWILAQDNIVKYVTFKYHVFLLKYMLLVPYFTFTVFLFEVLIFVRRYVIFML